MIEQALPILKDFKNIVLVEANDPVAFFAYPNKPSMLKPEGCEVHRMTSGGENSVAALEALAGALGARPADVKPQKLVELAQADRRADPCLDRAGDRDGDPGKRHRGR